MKNFLTNSIIVSAASVLAFAAIAAATPVTGIANIVGNVTVSATSVQFSPTITNTAGAMESGDFAGLTGGGIQSLTGGPATGNTFIPDFISFSSGVASPISFDLTYIAPGVGTVAACTNGALGSACTPAGSPFTLFQLSSNTVIAILQFNGVSYTGSAATGTSPTVGIFTTQSVVPGSVPEIYAMLSAGESITGITYSASLSATSQPSVPEPSSVGILGIGFLAVGFLTRHKALRS